MFSVSRPHGGGRVEGLRDGNEGHAVPVEYLDQLGEIRQRAAEAIDLVDHHHVDQPILDVLQQPLQAGPFKRAARDAAIVILIADQHPPFRPLTGDVGFACLALGVQAVELLLQPFLGGFPSVDRAA